MNIRVLHLSSERSWRGGEQQVAYLLEESKRLELTFSILGRKRSSFHTYADQRGFPYYSKEFSGVKLLMTALFLVRISDQYDVIHAHSGKSHTLTFLALLMGMRTPVIISRRVDFIPKSNFFTRWKYNHLGIKRIVGVSNTITEIMRSYLTRKRERCITIHSGVDLSRFSGVKQKSIRSIFNLPLDSFLIGNTSALADHKDYFTFLKVAQSLSVLDDTYHFVIMGEGPMAEEIKSYARDLNLLDRVTFTGFLKNIPEVIGDLNVFLMTSKTEGLGTSILDAFASRVPVVATRAGGIPEMVINNLTGLTAPVGDVSALVKNIITIRNNEKLRNDLVVAAYEKLNDFTKENMAAQTIEMYQEILNKS
ncbi:MAG: glycosyltransferase [Bacteroidota bacterium]